MKYKKKTYKSIIEMLNDDIKNLLTESFPVPGIKSRISMAARLNFAGVFTDVPPFCYEYGGCVVNTSILIDGKYPVIAEAETCQSNKLIFEYSDYNGLKKTFVQNSMRGKKIINNLFAVQRAVCSMLGISGGIKLSLSVNIPTGSGLGTSSIAAAACFKAVAALYSIKVKDMDIVRWVLNAEQMIGSGGGWQDQCGGIFPGLKLCSSQPGLPQKIDIEVLSENNPAAKAIEHNIAIIYSGNRRHSKDILRGIIKKIIISDAETIETLSKMKDNAKNMAAGIRSDNIKLFNELVNEQSELNKRISKDYFNKKLSKIEKKLSHYCDASIVSGAGGGGFFAAFLKNGVDYQSFKEYMMSGECPCEPKKVDFCIDKPAYLVEYFDLGEENA